MGTSQYCNQKQYINTVITGQNEDGDPPGHKDHGENRAGRGVYRALPRSRTRFWDYLYEEGLLYVLIGKACRNVNQTIYVDNDNVLAGREAAEYLLNLGHVRIACLSGDHSLLYNHDRKMGIYAGPWQSGAFLLTGQLCVEVPSVPEEQDQALAALFAREDRPTAVLVSDDILAVALEKACIGLGLSHTGGCVHPVL
ncbi:MAG: substrate-binding domain-containing protein [Enterocloster bolteae]